MRFVVLVLLFAASALQAQTREEMRNAEQLPDSAALLEPRRHLDGVELRLARDPDDRALRFERLGALYLLAVDEETLVEVGLEATDSLRARVAGRTDLRIRLDGYEGAFTVLRAKHAFWPHDKLSHVRSGLSMLDAAVAAAPRDAVLRYLRLMSGFYLPGLFGRGDEVDADFAALAHLLPHAAADFPGPMLQTVARFVLENGRVEPARAAELRALIRHG